MKIILTILGCIALVVVLMSCGSIIASQDPNRKSVEAHIADKLVGENEIYTLSSFFGGQTGKNVKGYILSVYDEYGIRYYCVYVQIDKARSDGRYLISEIDIQEELYNREYIFRWEGIDDE